MKPLYFFEQQWICQLHLEGGAQIGLSLYAQLRPEFQQAQLRIEGWAYLSGAPLRLPMGGEG